MRAPGSVNIADESGSFSLSSKISGRNIRASWRHKGWERKTELLQHGFTRRPAKHMISVIMIQEAILVPAMKDLRMWEQVRLESVSQVSVPFN